jgi:flagellar biosynthesis anti-sigma factor FlgM
MRIDPQIPASENSGTNRVHDAQSAATKALPSANAGQPNDTVHLSSDQATIRQLASQLSRVPDVRQERVSALRLELQTGQFQRSNDQVAGAIVGQLLGIHSNG